MQNIYIKNIYRKYGLLKLFIFMNKSYLSFWIIIYIIYLIYIILNKYLKIKYKKEYSFN